MPRPKKSTGPGLKTTDYRHKGSKRKNNPPAKLAAEGKIPKVERVQYSYNPHLPPILRFDPTGKPDSLPKLLAEARRRPLTDEEARILAEALRSQEPWLEWTGKMEEHRRGSFDVDPVAVHIHERVSTQAILAAAKRTDIMRDLFADPEMEYREAVKFYQHDVDWANRLILGDSLEVMSSLARREGLAGKVQMIYIDPPYGIKFASNFQPQVGKRDVKDKEQDLTREAEVVKAYRDTWSLGIHSYLSYLRDRLVLAHALLTDSGSVFLQISDDNVHYVRQLLDSIFGRESFCSIIAFRKTSAVSSPMARVNVLACTTDYILWYCRTPSLVKYRQLFLAKELGAQGASQYALAESLIGARRRLGKIGKLGDGERAFGADNLESMGHSIGLSGEFLYQDRVFSTGTNRHWKTTRDGLHRLAQAERLYSSGKGLSYVRYIDDCPVFPLTNEWSDTSPRSSAISEC